METACCIQSRLATYVRPGPSNPSGYATGRKWLQSIPTKTLRKSSVMQAWQSHGEPRRPEGFPVSSVSCSAG
jgi:hypothetical protein